MKFLLTRLLPLLALLTTAITIAGGTTAQVSWNAPTTYADGSALPLSDIAHYTLTWAPNAAQSGPSGSNTPPAGATNVTVPVACGSTTFVLTVTTTPTARYPNATSSPTSGVPYVTGVSCAPNPPSGLAVQ